MVPARLEDVAQRGVEAVAVEQQQLGRLDRVAVGGELLGVEHRVVLEAGAGHGADARELDLLVLVMVGRQVHQRVELGVRGRLEEVELLRAQDRQLERDGLDPDPVRGRADEAT